MLAGLRHLHKGRREFRGAAVPESGKAVAVGMANRETGHSQVLTLMTDIGRACCWDQPVVKGDVHQRPLSVAHAIHLFSRASIMPHIVRRFL